MAVKKPERAVIARAVPKLTQNISP